MLPASLKERIAGRALKADGFSRTLRAAAVQKFFKIDMPKAPRESQSLPCETWHDWLVLRALSYGVADAESMSTHQLFAINTDRHAARQAMGIDDPYTIVAFSDIASDLGATLETAVQVGFEAATVRHRSWCRQDNTLRTMHDSTVASLSSAGPPDAIGEGQEIPETLVSSTGQTLSPEKYAAIMAISEEGLRSAESREIDILRELPQTLIDGAVGKEDDIADAVLTTNAALSDGVALFDASNHGNIAVAGDIDPPSVATLNAMRKSMSQQTNTDGRRLSIVPRFVLVPSSLTETAADVLENSDLELISSPALEADSSTAWYASADPARHPGVTVFHLRGFETPQIDVRRGFARDLIKIRCRHIVAAAASDWRALYKNIGT